LQEADRAKKTVVPTAQTGYSKRANRGHNPKYEQDGAFVSFGVGGILSGAAKRATTLTKTQTPSQAESLANNS
jgi:hypothetical protein